MKHAPILMILAAGGLFGWFAPDLSERDEATEPAEAEQAEADAAEGEPQAALLSQSAWNEGEVVLPRAPDGHFYAEVSVDSASARMLVDTGASVVALTADDADRLGVRWNAAEIRPVAQGASGTVYGVPARLEHVQLGEIGADGVEAVVVPEGLGISLLGQSFLSQVGRVEMTDDRMTLGG